MSGRSRNIKADTLAVPGRTTSRIIKRMCAEALNLVQRPSEPDLEAYYPTDPVSLFITTVGQDNLMMWLEALGAGLLGQKVSGKELDQVLLNRFGQLILERYMSFQSSREERARQNARIAAVGRLRKLDRLRQLDPEEFEFWTASYFRRHGFRDVAVTSYSADFGIDVFVTLRNGRRAVIQCKRYLENVGRPTVQQTYGAMHLVGAKICYVVTTAGFSGPARELGRHRNIVLLDGDFLTSGKIPPGGKRKTRT
jgi:HJR/Mrr/RecB family endonuclease